VAKTWSITLNQLSSLARTILRITAWPAPDDIPRGFFLADRRVFSEALARNRPRLHLLAWLAPGKKVTISELAVEGALAELARFSLIRLSPETVSVHRLLQAVEQDALGEEERARWLEWAVRFFSAFAPGPPNDVPT
jgi:hypothetical protein